MRTPLASTFLLALLLTTSSAFPVSVTPNELAEASRWVAAKFGGIAETPPAEGYLMAYVKRGEVQRNKIIRLYPGIPPVLQLDGQPLRIADKQYHRGVYCPSEGRIGVHLPGPAKSFEAIVGVDSNRTTTFYSNAGRGSVIASVAVGGKELFKSEVMHEGMSEIPVKVDLGGAEEFALDVSDGGRQAAATP